MFISLTLGRPVGINPATTGGGGLDGARQGPKLGDEKNGESTVLPFYCSPARGKLS
jgi:hypothetical protein